MSLIPGNPILSSQSFFGGKTEQPTLLDAGQAIFTTSGRMALALTLQIHGIGPKDQILIPAYHCSSMVAPVTNTGAQVVFYRINPDMSVDIDDIKEKISDKSRGLLVAHFFGFPQPVLELRRLCDAHGLLLLEDCAHAFFGESYGEPFGKHGDYAFGSLMKFFPVFDGGCLVSSRHSLDTLLLESGGKLFELQSAFYTLEKSFEFNRLKTLHLLLKLPLAAKKKLWEKIKSRIPERAKGSQAPAASEGGFDFNPCWINKRMSFASRMLRYVVSTRRIATNRIKNYHRLTTELAYEPRIEVLHPSLPDGVVPYVFPILLENPDSVFLDLREQGVPLLRWEYLWEGVDHSICDVTNRYSHGLIQIPCHQELTEQELEWMIERIKARIRN